MDEAARKLIFPTPDPFLAEAKKVLASPSLWGKLGFPSWILFFSERKRFWPLANFIVVLCDTADPFCKEQKKDWEASGPKNHYNPTLCSERAFRNTRFAFFVLAVLKKSCQETFFRELLQDFVQRSWQRLPSSCQAIACRELVQRYLKQILPRDIA